VGYLGWAHGGAEMKEGGTFFAIALFFLVLFYGYIQSQGGMKGSTNLAIAQPSGPTDYHAMARQLVLRVSLAILATITRWPVRMLSTMA
jgi:hypothetical protein